MIIIQKIKNLIANLLFNDQSAFSLELAQHSQWIRKNIGGHWEHILVGTGASLFKMWIPLSECSKNRVNSLRNMNVRAHISCEDYHVKSSYPTHTSTH